MKESRGKLSDKYQGKTVKPLAESGKSNKGYREETYKTTLEDDSKSSLDGSEDLSSSDVAAVNRSKSSDSEEDNITDMSVCSSNAGGNSSNSSEVGRLRQYNGSSSLNNKPEKPIISFLPGTRLEAKDLGNEVWYAVKIVEVDWDDNEILIHFEKWSNRYDEWIPMDSSRLRSMQESSPGLDTVNSVSNILKTPFKSLPYDIMKLGPDRPDIQNKRSVNKLEYPLQISAKKNSKIFKVGDKVMATWSDSRKYPAKVKSVLTNDRYEVLFFDGFTKIIKGVRMTKIKENETLTVAQVPPGAPRNQSVSQPPPPVAVSPLKMGPTDSIGTKEDRRERKRKINVSELFPYKKRSRLDPEALLPKVTPDRPILKRKRGERRKNLKEVRQRRNNYNENSETEAERSSLNRDTNLNHTESVVMHSEPDQTAGGISKKKCEVGLKLRRKVNPKNISEQPKPRRRFKNEEFKAKAKDVFKKDIMEYKMTKKLARRCLQDGGSPFFQFKLKKGILKGSSDDVTPSDGRGKKKDVQESEPPKSCPKPSHDDWEPEGQVAYIVEGSEGPRKSIIIADTRLPQGWTKHTIQRMTGHSAGKWDVFLVCPKGRKFRSRQELRNYFEEKGEIFQKDRFDFSLGRRKIQRGTSEGNSSSNTPSTKPSPQTKLTSVRAVIARGKAPFGPGGDGVEQPLRRVKTLLPKIRPPQEEERTECLGNNAPPSPPPPYTTTVAHTSASKIPEEGLESGVIVAGLKIQMENDAFKCPKDGCSKNFRKENLLQMHIKHYHPEYNKFMGSTPNVADLAYARTIGEPVEELLPRARYSVGGPAFLEKINRFEATRKAKAGTGGAGGDCVLPERKKAVAKEGKQGGQLAGKKTIKGELDGRPLPEDSASDTGVPVEESSQEKQENPAATREERKEQPSIKTLLPVIRSPVPDVPVVDRLKNRCLAEEGEEYIDVLDVAPKKELLPLPQQPAQQAPVTPQTQQTTPNLTKSVRAIRRRHLSDFHMEPLFKKRKSSAMKMSDLLDDVDVTEDVSLSSDRPVPVGKASATYRFSRKKMPVVHLEKLQLTTDSNECEERSKSPPAVDVPQTRVEQLRREEIINCTCGYMEEDGLMIQCDLCLCWQHGLCNNIEKETEVPEKYVCPICLNPARERRSLRYLHDQDWLKEGALPSLSFRSKNSYNISQREVILKRSHELTGTLLQLRQVIHSLRVKVNIAEKTDHPKLYLWAKSWEKNGPDQSQSVQQSDTKTIVNNSAREKENLFKEEKQHLMYDIKKEPQDSELPCKPESEVVKDSSGTGPGKLKGEERCEPITSPSTVGNEVKSEDQDKAMACPEHQTPCNPPAKTEDSSAPMNGEGLEDHAVNSKTKEMEVQKLDKNDAGHKDEKLDAPAVVQNSTKKCEENQPQECQEETVQNGERSDSGGAKPEEEDEEEEDEEEEDEEEEEPQPQADGHLLHQALTDGVDTSASSQNMLQLPICQTELMHFASSMADKLDASEAAKAPEPPRAPQPEAPIDPVECRFTLLDHIDHYHQQIDSRLTSLEAQIAALESLDPHLASDETANFYPQTKQTVQMLLKDLTTLRHIAVLN